MLMEMEYLGPLSETVFGEFGRVKRGKTIPVPKEIAEATCERHPKSWKLIKKEDSTSKSSKKEKK